MQKNALETADADTSTNSVHGHVYNNELIKSADILPERQTDFIPNADNWHSSFSSILGSKSFVKVADLFEQSNLNLTSRVTGVQSDVDYSVASFPFIMDAIRRVTSFTGEKIYLYEDDLWKDMTSASVNSWIPKPSKSGATEIAVVDRFSRLQRRFSIFLWNQVGDHLECTSPVAPLKKTILESQLAYVSYDTMIKPVDVVYTWVNSDDVGWKEMIKNFKDLREVDSDRFAQIDELKYSIRSVFTFAPWVRKVFVFSNCQPPEWFEENDRISWVMHDQVIEPQYLPLFSSHSIEMFLHKIPGLSERYIYFNDDVFLSGFVRPSDFFTAYGQSISRMEPYGVLPYFSQAIDIRLVDEWQAAAINCARIFYEKFGVYPTRVHRHTPHAFRKYVYTKMLERFPDEAEVTKSNKFRSPTDFTFTSFLYHHFALAIGKGVHVNEDGAIVRATNYKRFLEKKTYSRLRFFCINDGGGSSKDSSFAQFKKSFLEDRYSFKSPAEK